MMRVGLKADTYIKSSEDLLTVAAAWELRQTRPLLEAIRSRIEELRRKIETVPVHSDDLREDCGGILCEIRGLSFLPTLVDEAKERVNSLGV